MKKVIILGGGVAGMSAAHELIERGYQVEVYDKNKTYVGGKARSVDYNGDPNDPYKIPLPGEHGFRFFPGFYKHVIDTMKRIPFTSANGKVSSVYNNLTPTSRVMLARYGKEPIVTVASFPKNIKDVQLLIHDMHGVDSGLSKQEIEFFGERIWQLMTSSNRRRNNDYERLGWWQYLEADRFPGKDGKASPYQSLLVEGLTRTLVAAQAKSASTKTGGNIFLQLIFGMTDPSVETDRVLDGPTNERWLNAWKDYLLSKGVQYMLGCEVKAVKTNNELTDSKIIGASIQFPDGTTKEVQGDYYIMAVPVEQAAKLISDDLIKADQTLGYIKTLAPSVSWMNGIQFYLNENAIINQGHVIYSDSQWAITSISQVQFWKDYDITTKGNGQVKGVLSVDVSDWKTPGKFTTQKWACHCTRKEVADEVWEQLKHSLNVPGKAIVLRDEMRVDWFLDRDISEKATQHNDEVNWDNVVSEVWSTLNKNLDADARETLKNDSTVQWIIQQDIKSLQSITDTSLSLTENREPLLVNNVSTWGLRPDASCDIRNLFFASDYVRTHTDLATMEGANEAARRAVNCLLDKDGQNIPKCKIWPLREPSIFKPLKWYDEKRWNNGLPWTMYIPWWLKLCMIVWGVLCLIGGLYQLLVKKISKLFTKKN